MIDELFARFLLPVSESLLQEYSLRRNQVAKRLAQAISEVSQAFPEGVRSHSHVGSVAPMLLLLLVIILISSLFGRSS